MWRRRRSSRCGSTGAVGGLEGGPGCTCTASSATVTVTEPFATAVITTIAPEVEATATDGFEKDTT